MKVSLHPAAENDIEEAAEFYERTGSLALAAKFIAEFKRVSQLLLEFPGIGSSRSRGRQGFSEHVSVHGDLPLQRRWNRGLDCQTRLTPPRLWRRTEIVGDRVHAAQRIRLDRDRAASHDLNRLWDEPGP